MNQSVTASGMQVTASNDTGYMLIGTKTGDNYSVTPTVSSLRSAKTTTAALGGVYTNTSIKPVDYAAAVAGIETADTVSNWFYKIADDPSAYSSTKTSTALTSFSGYVLAYDLYVALAEGSADMTNLKVKSCTISAVTSGATAMAAVRVLVCSDDAKEEFYLAHTEGGTDKAEHVAGDTTLAATIDEDATDPIHLRVYIYVDGEDSTIYTNNALNLNSTKVELVFTASN